MDGKSDEDLQKYLDNCITYTPEAVEYAIVEMEKRGKIFSDEELNGVRHKMQLKREAEEAEEKEARQPMDINIVTDETAPSYYSQRAIYSFGIFFSVLFGAVLLAINVNNAGSKRGVWKVIIFGIIYSVFQISMSSMILFTAIKHKYSFVIIIGAIGMLLMNELFWKKYIGKDTKYRTRPIWMPLIIGLVLFTPLVLAVIYRGI